MPVHEHPDRPYDWVGDWSHRRARLTPDRVGLVDASTGERFTYATLDDRANRMARLLARQGVTNGSRVAVVSRNRPAFVDLFFGCGKTGGVLAPVSHRLAPPEQVELLDRIDPDLLVVEYPFLEPVREALARSDSAMAESVMVLPPRESDPGEETVPDSDEWENLLAARPTDPSPVDRAPLALDDPCLFLHTGGSTGTPKETVITHGNVLWNSINTITAWGLREDDITPMVFPMFHTGGWNVITVPLWHMGGTVLIAREVTPQDVLRQISAERATVLVAVPAVLRAMTEAEEWAETDLSSLRFVKSGGGPCRDAVLESWWDRGVELSQGYGLTECGPNNFAMPDGWPREKAGSVGVPAMHVDARIVNTDGDPVEPGEIGELELASPHAAAEYWEDPVETEAAFGPTREDDAGGWVSTGDLVRRDAAGYYYIEGRKKNMFVSGGENVYPAEVENAIADHPGVREVVVVPIPDEQWGQVGKAVIEGDRSLTLDELAEFLDGRLARFKRPRALAFVDEMPVSGPSKIDREAVAAQFGAEDPPG